MNNHTFNYVYPPDFHKAQRHRLANRIFKGDPDASAEECQCCGKRIGEQQVETNCSIDPNQFSFLGPGVPLFFLYLKFIIVLLVVMSVFFMGFAIFSNVTSNDCGTISSCVPDLFNTLSLINKQSKTSYMEIQSYLGLLFVVICILFFHYFRYNARKLIQQCDEIVDSPSDYAIILRRLPQGVTEREIAELVEGRRRELSPEELARAGQLKVNKIVMSYSLREYSQARQRNLENFKKCAREDRMADFKCQELPKPTEPSHIAIVVFESQAAKEFFIHRPTLRQKVLQFFCTPCIPLSQLQIRGENIGIERAPQPDEIHWQNSGITMRGAIGRKTLMGMISVVVLMVGGATQYGLSVLANSTTNSTTQTVLTTLSSLIVTVFNVILMLVLGVLTKKERNETETEDQTVLMVKVTIFQFLNAGVFVVMSEIAASYSTFSLAKGICSQITLIMVLNAVLPNLTLLFLDYSEILNKVLRFCVGRGWLVYSQAELNQVFIGSTIDLHNKYAYILKTLWLTAIYSPLIPIVVGVSALGLLLFYAVQKFLYTRSYCMPSNVSSMSYESAVELLQYFLITFSLGELIIYFYFYNFQYESIPLTWTATILATVSLAILNSALPMEAINEYLFPVSPSSKSDLTYSQVENQFEVTYQMTNPAYQTNRQRNHSKGSLGISKENNPKAVAIQLVNLFGETLTKNNESLTTQKPLLTEFIQNQAGEEQRESDLAREEVKEQAESEAEAKVRAKEQPKEIEKTLPQPKPYTKQEKLASQPPPHDSTTVSNTAASPTCITPPPKQSKVKTLKKEKQALGQRAEIQQKIQQKESDEESTPKIQKKRKYVPPPSPVNKKELQPVDPFQDLSSFKPPTFVIRWRQEQAELERQRAIKEKEDQKRAARENAEQKKKPKLSKPPEQSTIKLALLNESNEPNVDSVYANLMVAPQNAPKPESSKVNPIHLSLENVPIDSKYHQSGGKLNIYEEFIDPNHRSPIYPRFKKQRTPMKIESPKPKEPQVVDEPIEKTPKIKGNRHKFVVINEVPLKSSNVKRKEKLSEESSMQNQTIHPPLSLQKLSKSQQNLLSKAEQDVNEAYKDAFGKSSNLNSRSSLHNGEDPKTLQERKQRKEVYNPMAIKGSYKRYFKNKYQSPDADIFEGFLDKKMVMSYIGTPFLNLAKTMPPDVEDPK